MIVWDDEERQWIDDETGRAATAVAVMAARDTVADEYATAFRQLAILYTSGQITLEAWRLQFEALVIEAIARGYTFGRGGIDLMGDGDWDRIAQQVKHQLEYANGFADDVAVRVAAAVVALESEAEAVIDEADAEQQARTRIEPAMTARSELYAGATVEAFEEANVVAHSAGKGVLILPVYPADHGTECRSACRCGWHITGDETARVWRCVWITAGDPGVCDGCRERGRLYANLIIPYDGSAPPIE